MTGNGAIEILDGKTREQVLYQKAIGILDEQVKDLKETAAFLYHAEFYWQASVVNQAADTIKALSADGKIGTVAEF